MKLLITISFLFLSVMVHAVGADTISDEGTDYCKVSYTDNHKGDFGIYRGQCNSNKPHGTGTVTYRNGDTLSGVFKNGVLEGTGKFRSSDGNTYEGNWMNGMRHGNGTFIWARGSSYAGQWTENKKHGAGVYTWANGNRFEGEFRNDRRYNGKYYTSNGRVYRCRLGQCK